MPFSLINSYLVLDMNLTQKFRIFFSYQLGLPIPETCGGAELKPGSLPNLTNLEIGHSNNHPLHGLNQDSSQANCGPGGPGSGPGGLPQNSEESPISSVRVSVRNKEIIARLAEE